MKKMFISVAVLILVAVAAFVVFMSSGGKSLIIGYSLKCNNDTYMIIEETGSPIRYNFNKAVGTSAEKLDQGDRILIISDLINESYPASTSAYLVFKLSDGDIDDIPAETISSLEELGWYNSEE